MILEWKGSGREDNLLAHRIRGPMSSFKEKTVFSLTTFKLCISISLILKIEMVFAIATG